MGKYTKIKADGVPIKGKKKPIIVNDPNDPRLLAYNDSLYLHNAGIDMNDIMLKDFIWKDKGKHNPSAISSAQLSKLIKDDFPYAVGLSRHKPVAESVNFLKIAEKTGYKPTGGNSYEDAYYTFDFENPTQPYKYKPYVKAEKLNINQIPITGTNNSTVQGRNIPTPQSPVNPLPVDDIQLYTAHQNLANQGKPVGYYMQDGKRFEVGASEYNQINGSDIMNKKYAMGGNMNQAQQLNAGKMRVGSDAPDGSVWKDIGAGAYGVLEGTLDTVSMGMTDKLTDAGYKGLQKLGGSGNTRQQDMIRGFGNIGGAVVGAVVNPASTMTAVKQGIKGLGQGIGNINENTQGIGNAISGLSGLTGLIPSGGGMEKLSAMGAQMSFKQGGLMKINEGGTHEQNALGGVPIGPNALVEQGETINNDFVFSDRLKPKGSKKTYAQLSKSVDTKYRLRPDDKLSKEAKQMDLDRLAAQQEAQKDEMSTKYMQKAMACGGKIMSNGGSFMGPISQSMNVTNGQNTMLANGGLMSNFIEPATIYQNPANLSNQYAMGGNMYDDGGPMLAPVNSPYRINPYTMQNYNQRYLSNLDNIPTSILERPASFGPNTPLFEGPNDSDSEYIDSDPSSNSLSLEQSYPKIDMNSFYMPNSPLTNIQSPTPYQIQSGVPVPKMIQPTPEMMRSSITPNTYAANSAELNKMGQMQGNAFDKSTASAQNPYPEVGNTGYLTNLAGNLVKAGMVATSKPPIYNPSVKFNRMNANPAERLAMQEGRREIQGTKDIIRNNATSSGQYLTNASLMGSSAANKLAGTIGGIRQGYDQQNVGINNQEAQLNQQIVSGNNLAKEQFRDNRLNQYNKILDSVIGANQQRFSTDEHANKYQNQILNLLKSGDYQISFDAKGNPTIIPTTK